MVPYVQFDSQFQETELHHYGRRGRGEHEVRQMINTQKFWTSKAHFVCQINKLISQIIFYPFIIGTLYMFFNITLQRRCLQVCPAVPWEIYILAFLTNLAGSLARPTHRKTYLNLPISWGPHQYGGGQIRRSFWIRLTNSRIWHPNVNFWINVWNKNWSQDILEELEFFQIIVT
jgi:hypothetical protein